MVQDAVDGEGGLGYVGGHDHLASAALGLVEDLGLQLGGQQRVDGEHADRGHLGRCGEMWGDVRRYGEI